MANNAVTTPLSTAQMQSVARALADPRRYEILLRLAADTGESTACVDMRSCVEISPATFSHHMKELEAAGLVTAVRAGKFMRYALNRPTLEAYMTCLQTQLL